MGRSGRVACVGRGVCGVGVAGCEEMKDVARQGRWNVAEQAFDPVHRRNDKWFCGRAVKQGAKRIGAGRRTEVSSDAEQMSQIDEVEAAAAEVHLSQCAVKKSAVARKA